MKVLLGLLLIILSTNFGYGQFWNIVKYNEPIRTTNNNFGESVFVDDDYIIIGAPGGGIGIDKKEYVYIYNNTEGELSFEQTITFEETVASIDDNSRFGSKIARLGDYLFVSAPNFDFNEISNSGSIFIYKKQTPSNEWNFHQQVTPENPQVNGFFGSRISAEDELFVVGSPNENFDTLNDVGAAYIYSLNNSNDWTLERKLIPAEVQAEMQFGASVSIDGNRIAIGAPNSKLNDLFHVGNVYLYNRFVDIDTAIWNEIKVFNGPVIGANNRGYNFGMSVSLEANTLVVGAPAETTISSFLNYQGKVYVIQYDAIDDIWNLATVISASDGYNGNNFGYKVDLSNEYLAVKGSLDLDNIHNGKVYLYQFDGANWNENTTFISQNQNDYDGFGFDFDLSDSTLVIGDSWDALDQNNSNFLSNSGSIYIAQLSNINSIYPANKINVRLFPNPSSHQIQLSATIDLEGAKYTITAMNGQLLIEGTITNGIIDVSNIPPGMHYLSIISQNQLNVIPFVKIN